MRDLALTGLFVVLLFYTFKHTWVGALLWTWFSLMNPHRMTYGFAQSMPFAAAAAGATFLSLLWNRDKNRFPHDPSIYILILFVLWMCLTTAMAIFPQQSMDRLILVLKIQVMTLVCAIAIRERKHIELFVWVNALSIGFYGIKGGVFGILTGGSARVWGPADSFIEDNNSLGLSIVMIIPLLYFLRQVATHRWIRRGLLVAMLLCAVGVLSTQSRGAFLAISVMTLFLWTRMKKKLLPGIGIVAAAVLLVTFMPESWESRMRTINTYQADSSAMQRINAWELAINVANDRVTGAGFAIATRAIFDKYAPNPEWVFTAHSIYFQVIGEHGYIGFALWVSLGILGFWNAARLRKRAKERPETMWLHELAGMIQVSMIGYAIGGAFLSLAYFDLPYNIMVMLIAGKYWLREERWKTETVGAFGSTSSAERSAEKSAQLAAART